MIGFLIFGVSTTVSTYLKCYWLPTADLINTIADDEFYVLQVAKNFATGNEVSFDGTALTTGFHPLYFIILTAIYSIAQPDSLTFIKISITLKALLSLFSAFLIFKISLKLSTNVILARTIGIILSLIFFTHPYIMFLIFSGIEQLLSIFFFLCFLLCYTTITAISKPLKNGPLFLCGLILGFTYLSRTDNIILLPTLLIFVLVSNRKNLPRGLKNISLLGLGYFVMIIPWYIFIYIETGALSQGSGEVKMFLSDRGSLPFFERILSTWQFIKQVWWPFLNHELTPLYKLFLGLLFVTGLYFILDNLPQTIIRKWPRYNSKVNTDIILVRWNNLHIAGLCIFYIIAVPITYGYFFNAAREWYYGTSIVAIIILIFVLINFLFSYLKNSFLQKMAILIILLFSFIPLQSSLQNQESHLNKWSHQHEMLYVSEWIKSNLPLDVKIGSWNSGIYGYFSERSVTNLDGLINNEILPYLKSNDLYTYIEKRKINYIIDYAVMIYWNEKFLGKSLEDITLDEDTTFSGSWSQSDISVWRIIH